MQVLVIYINTHQDSTTHAVDKTSLDVLIPQKCGNPGVRIFLEI